MVALVKGLDGVRDFGEHVLPRNDDDSAHSVDITPVFENGLVLFGQRFTEVYVNNNGSITFNGPRSTFTPDVITASSGNPEITPFFADVDTRMGIGTEEPADLEPTPGGNSTGSNLVYYDLDSQADQFTVTWDDVGFFDKDTSKLNAFQLILTDEGSGNFNIEFRYEDVNWTTGDFSDGQDGLGGIVARAGWTAGTGNQDEFFELPQSGDEQGILDLDQTPGNTGQPGRWFFSVRDGDVVDSEIPDRPEDPRIGASHGDPHLVTFDRASYDFHAAGEFVLAREVDGPIEIHARQEPVTDTLSWNTAVATSLGDAVVMIDARDDDVLQVDGEPLSLGDFQTAEVGNGLIGREGNTYTVVYPGEDGEVNDGDERLIVDVVRDRLDLRVEIDEGRDGAFEGLLGNADGDAGNDIATADGMPLARPLPFEALYGDFREDWRIGSAEESLLDYDEGESPATFYDPDFPGVMTTLDDIAPGVREQAEQAAQDAGLQPGTANFRNAVLDFAATGDESFLDSALDAPEVDEENAVAGEDGGEDGSEDPGDPPTKAPNAILTLTDSTPDTFFLGSGLTVQVYGDTSGKTLNVTDGAGALGIGVNTTINLEGASSDFSFYRNGTTLEVVNGSDYVVLALSAGTRSTSEVVFSDGSATMSVSGTQIAFGGEVFADGERAGSITVDPSKTSSDIFDSGSFGTVLDLDDLGGTFTRPATTDVSGDSVLLMDSADLSSITEVSGFGADDTIEINGTHDAVIAVSNGNTNISFDDGAGIVSEITLVGVSGFFSTVAEFNAISNLGDITFA